MGINGIERVFFPPFFSDVELEKEENLHTMLKVFIEMGTIENITSLTYIRDHVLSGTFNEEYKKDTDTDYFFEDPNIVIEEKEKKELSIFFKKKKKFENTCQILQSQIRRELLLEKSGIKYNIIQTHLLMQYLIEPSVRTMGHLHLPIQSPDEFIVPFIDERDVIKCCVKLLCHKPNQQFNFQVFKIIGRCSLSFSFITSKLSKIVKKPVKIITVTKEGFIRTCIKNGMNKRLAIVLSQLYKHYEEIRVSKQESITIETEEYGSETSEEEEEDIVDFPSTLKFSSIDNSSPPSNSEDILLNEDFKIIKSSSLPSTLQLYEERKIFSSSIIKDKKKVRKKKKTQEHSEEEFPTTIQNNFIAKFPNIENEEQEDKEKKEKDILNIKKEKEQKKKNRIKYSLGGYSTDMIIGKSPQSFQVFLEDHKKMFNSYEAYLTKGQILGFKRQFDSCKTVFETIKEKRKRKMKKKDFLELLGLNLGESLFSEAIFRAFDCNKDGEITRSEYLCAMSILMNGSREEKLEFAFKMFDVEDNGTIKRKQFVEIIDNINTILEKKMNFLKFEDFQKFFIEKLFENNHTEDCISIQKFKEVAFKYYDFIQSLGSFNPETDNSFLSTENEKNIQEEENGFHNRVANKNSLTIGPGHSYWTFVQYILLGIGKSIAEVTAQSNNTISETEYNETIEFGII